MDFHHSTWPPGASFFIVKGDMRRIPLDPTPPDGDGERRKGVLVKPDGFDPSKEYPMMVYFYERSSNRIHSFPSPNIGTSPNAAYYVSNGYLWFVPDIVYRDGYPGESCEKCVVSGVQHLLTKGFVDKDRIGAAGHSWGGYQTAHLSTRTDIFAAGATGATGGATAEGAARAARAARATGAARASGATRAVEATGATGATAFNRTEEPRQLDVCR